MMRSSVSSVSKGNVAMASDGDDHRSNAVTLDLTQARHNFGSDENLLHEIAIVFIEDVPGLAAELQAACLRNDFAAVARMAHSLKSLCATFGAEPARSYAQRLELDAANSRSSVTLEKIAVLVDSLNQTISRLQNELRISA